MDSGMGMWFRGDIHRILASKAQAAARYGDAGFVAGYLAALDDLAVEFGVEHQGEGGEWVHHSPQVHYIDAERGGR